MKVPTLRLFGVKTNRNIIIINDMQYLNQTGDISIVIPKNKYPNDAAYNYLQSLGFDIIGKIDIPKYDIVFICNSNPYSLVKLHNKVNQNLKPEEIKMIQDVTQLGINNSPSSKEKFINNIKNNIEKAFKEYKRKINELSSIDNIIYGKRIEDDFYSKIVFENNLKITAKSPLGFTAEVRHPHDDIGIIKITCICKDNTIPEQIYHYFTK